MSIETLTQTSETPQSTGGDEFTADEKAYFDSKGESALSDSGTDATSTAEPASKATDRAKPELDIADDDPEGTLVVDAQGRMRDKKSGKWMPHGAWHAEREGRKAAQQEAMTLRESMARVNERLAIMNQAFEGATGEQQQAAQKKPAAPPDPETDIFGYAKWLGDQLQAVQTKYDTDIKATTQRVDDSETASNYKADATAFMREKPDFGDAYTHLVQSVLAELEFRGMTDPKERMAEVVRIEKQEVALARKAGKRPAEWVYNLARMRGWSGAAQQKAAPTAQAKSEPTVSTAEADARLSQIEKGQNAARSLTGAGGGAAVPLNWQELDGMSEAEFKAALAKVGGTPNEAFRKLLNTR